MSCALVTTQNEEVLIPNDCFQAGSKWGAGVRDVTKPKINSDWTKICSGPNSLQALHMEGTGEGGYSLKMLEGNTKYYNSLNNNPLALIIGPILEVRVE